ncbi:thioredoxin [Salpingoeca rosetta]|uniref:Thioredoxin n=1 Tax=Salpingoeca rosetta (strain ATCC 50818 / BSB-021) TaxID=946362 RepID=F2UAH5_SALR5|nr:thioredoxin [Salpingoeca rosetta]EGD73391.1 thioredoxin [Salpingoeca rosetta]|eukprot:XP_004993673.1 thioredoxin [Salpingoeca rosetta]
MATMMVAARRAVRAAVGARRLMSAHSFDITSTADFKSRVLTSDTPVLVDFTAAWCGPCRMLKPILEKAVADQDGKVLLAKVDVDANSELAQEFQIASVPTVLGMKNGAVVNGFMGVQDAAGVNKFIVDLLDE